MKKILFITILSIFNFSYSQTSNENLNSQLQLMKKYFLVEDYAKFANFTNPKIIEMFGGKAKMNETTKNLMLKMKDEGFSFIDINFKDPSKFIKKGNEIQFTITQQLLMNTPNGKLVGNSTLIGISKDNGKNWTFIDSAGKSKEAIRKIFPNMSPNLVLIPKKQEMVEDNFNFNKS